jgi:hypothetical protein
MKISAGQCRRSADFCGALPPPALEACSTMMRPGENLDPSTSTCRPADRRHGPPCRTAADGAANRLTCRHMMRRQPSAARPSGGILHVSPGGSAATPEVVLFVICTHRWSFLSMNWAGWSFLPKNPEVFSLSCALKGNRKKLCLGCTHRLPCLHNRGGVNIVHTPYFSSFSWNSK